MIVNIYNMIVNIYNMIIKQNINTVLTRNINMIVGIYDMIIKQNINININTKYKYNSWYIWYDN